MSHTTMECLSPTSDLNNRKLSDVILTSTTFFRDTKVVLTEHKKQHVFVLNTSSGPLVVLASNVTSSVLSCNDQHQNLTRRFLAIFSHGYYDTTKYIFIKGVSVATCRGYVCLRTCSPDIRSDWPAFITDVTRPVAKEYTLMFRRAFVGVTTETK